MSLSVCLITADPPGRLATILDPLRSFADEVVIAADSRVEEATLAGYRALADKLFRIEYRTAERHLAWLCEQCDGDWALRLDGDEVPSAAFVRRLPEMLASREICQFWTSQAWLYPDAEHALAETPWAGDFHVRLMRNDGSLRSPGVQHIHVEPAAAREYVAEPFYHLDLLLSDERQRRDKAIRYEVARPHLRAAGGGRINEVFYLPELRPKPELTAVPAEDRDAIARALAASGTVQGPSGLGDEGTPAGGCPPGDAGAGPATSDADATGCLGDVPFVGLSEMDRACERMCPGEGAYEAGIDLHEPFSTLTPDEERAVFFAVTNEGDERWPAGLQERPPIRLAYRWLNADGSVHLADGLRSPFPRRVRPGERLLVPLHVQAPTATGDYVLEVDVVHEHVRWFGRPCRVPVAVARAAAAPAAGARLRETPVSRRGPWRRVLVPRTVHRLRLGAEWGSPGYANAEPPECPPGWQVKAWGEADLAELDIGEPERARAGSPSELANLARYEILHRVGGVFFDADFERLCELTPSLRGVEAFAVLELPGLVGTAAFGAVPGHRAFARTARLARGALGLGEPSVEANGAYLLSLVLEQETGVTIFAADVLSDGLAAAPQPLLARA